MCFVALNAIEMTASFQTRQEMLLLTMPELDMTSAEAG